jgi:hypothetical protein
METKPLLYVQAHDKWQETHGKAFAVRFPPKRTANAARQRFAW